MARGTLRPGSLAFTPKFLPWHRTFAHRLHQLVACELRPSSVEGAGAAQEEVEAKMLGREGQRESNFHAQPEGIG